MLEIPLSNSISNFYVFACFFSSLHNEALLFSNLVSSCSERFGGVYLEEPVSKDWELGCAVVVLEAHYVSSPLGN